MSLQKNVLCVTVGFFLLFAGFDGAQQYFVPLLSLRGQGALALDCLVIVYLTFFACNFIAPKCVQHLGAKWALVLGSVPYALFSFAVQFGAWAMVVACALVGAGAALLWNASSIVVALSSSDETNGRNASLKYGALVLGGFLGVLLGGMQIERMPVDRLFWYFGVVTIIGVAAFLPISLANNPLATKSFSLSGLYRSEMMLLFPIVFAGFFGLILGVSGLKLLTLQRFGLAWVGPIGTLFKAAALIASFGSGPAADSFPKLPLVMVLAVFGGLGAVIVMSATSVPFFCAGVILSGLSVWSIYPTIQALLRERIGLEGFNAATGTFHVYTTAGMLAGLVASSYLSATACFAVSDLLSMGAVPFLMAFGRRSQ